MRRYASRQAFQTLSEINVTPLIDLAFVLLIIFMITTPLMESELELVIPTSKAAEGAVKPENVLIVGIDRAGVLSLDGEPVSLEILRTELARRAVPGREIAVAVRADKTLSIQVLVDVMDTIKNAGITKVGLMTRPEKASQ